MKEKRLKSDVPVRFFINEGIKIEQNAVNELEEFLQVQETVEKIKKVDADFFAEDSKVLEVSITPDFHKGAGIPVGTTILTKGMIIPQAVGNDINCGMRLYTTDLNEEEIRGKQSEIEKKLRHVFFEGGRDIPMTRKNRTALLQEGLIGIYETHKQLNQKGIWQYYDQSQQEKDLSRVNKMGSFIASEARGFEDFIGIDEPTYDSQIGSIGGGNHFVEIQKVTEIKNAQIAKEWGIKKGQIVIMIHTGSVAIGHQSGAYIRELLKDIYPNGVKHPDNGIYIMPKSEKYKKQWQQYWSQLHNAANFAFGNRLFLGLMMKKSLTEALRDFNFQLLYDAPHNYVWEEEVDEKESFLHRKGSCTAKSAEQMQGTVYQYTGEPIFIPGSMGAKSYILSGMGNRNALFSASHGAGRKMSRGESLKVDDQEFRNFMSRFNVITPIDPKRTDVKGRMDIISKWEEELKKEAPYAYKDISLVIQSHEDHKMASIVAEVEPILTLKG